MLLVELQEHEPGKPVPLSVPQRDLLRTIKPPITVTAADDSNGEYILHPGSTVGAVEIGDLSVLIKPKVGIPHLLWMASYAIGKVNFRIEDFRFDGADSLPDVLAFALVAHARRAFSRGLLHGYLTQEEALYTVRGRIRFDEQIRRRFSLPLPVEVQYDEFTEDILANCLVKAAAQQLRRFRLRSRKTKNDLGWIAGILDNVSLVEFSPSNVPTVTFDRLNDHYRSVVELSRLVLRHSAFESSRGKVRASGFLMDMNQVFQEFVTVAVREQLRLSERTFGEYWICSLDKVGLVHLRPDLVWRSANHPIFVGDAKYKRITSTDFPNADIYQILAYCTAANLPSGLLIYAAEDHARGGHDVKHCITNANKTIELAAIDLSGQPEDILKQVKDLACRVERQAGRRSSRKCEHPAAVVGV